MNSGITTAGLLDYQLGDHPPERRKRCGIAVRHGMRGTEMGLLLSLKKRESKIEKKEK